MNKLLITILLCFNYVNAQTLCDSLSFSVGTSSGLTVIGVNSSSDSTNFMWGVCDKSMCYSSSGDTAYFFLVNPLDTVKVCYDISPQWTCNDCGYVVFTGYAWQLVSVITHVNELKPPLKNNKMYNLLGKEIYHPSKNGLYIKNGILYK